MSDYRGRTPYSNFRQHKMQYARGYRGQEQHNIGQRPERGNYNEENRARGRSDQRFNNGNNQGNGHGNDKHKGNDHGKGNNRDD